mmetsp:Transcript_32451/g.74119  ORF Transcript_32451/g.74119 Transcript_32451/m.74119 type:complete len:268 (+) Transcript_32451:326-1129(+)
MFVFGYAANVSDSGAAASISADGIPFAFNASLLPAVDGGDAAASGGAQATGDGEEAGDKIGSPLFGSRGEREGAIRLGQQHCPAAAMHCSAVHAAGPLSDAVTEEKLMDSGHELHESHICTLCYLPIELPAAQHSMLMHCCMKRVCYGCFLALHRREMEKTCAFCRTPTPDSDAAKLSLVQKRVDAKDPVATALLADAYYNGDYVLQQDISRAIELWTEAANLGNLNAHFRLVTDTANGKLSRRTWIGAFHIGSTLQFKAIHNQDMG